MSVGSVILLLISRSSIRHIIGFLFPFFMLFFSLSLLQELVLSLSTALLLSSLLISDSLASFFVLSELVLGGLVVSLILLGCEIVRVTPLLL